MEKVELSEEERRDIFKKLKKYEASKNWKEIVKECKSDWEDLIGLIDKEISTRIEAKVKHSELDKLRIYVSIFREVLSKVDGSEWGKLFKTHLEEQLKNADTNIYDKVEIGFDSPLYSELDMLKTEMLCKRDYVWDKIDEISTFYDKVEEKEPITPMQEAWYEELQEDY